MSQSVIRERGPRPHSPSPSPAPAPTPAASPTSPANPANPANLADAPPARPRAPVRAKSVCLAERPHCRYVRSIRSADSTHPRLPETLPAPPPRSRRADLPADPVVRQLKRKAIQKTPLRVPVLNISIPMPCDRDSSTSKHLENRERFDTKKKSSHPKQVGENRRLCQAAGGKETENKLLLQISEAEQVSDFERILSANAVLWEHAEDHVWRGSVAARTPSSSLLPRSSYSLEAVTRAYHDLFQQHEEAVRPLVERHHQDTAAGTECGTPSSLEKNWYENLHDLSEYYEDDRALQREIETITDRIIDEKVKSSKINSKNKNFNVNLTDLIGLHVSGEGVSPTGREEQAPSPEIEKEWLTTSMSSNLNERDPSEHSAGVERLAKSLDSIQLGYDAKVPTITFSNCCERRDRSERADNVDAVIHLAVPSADSGDEARPPM